MSVSARWVPNPTVWERRMYGIGLGSQVRLRQVKMGSTGWLCKLCPAQGPDLLKWKGAVSQQGTVPAGLGIGLPFPTGSKAIYRPVVDRGGCLLHALNFIQV